MDAYYFSIIWKKWIKNITKPRAQKRNHSVQTRTKNLNKQFTEEEIQTANKHMKKW